MEEKLGGRTEFIERFQLVPEYGMFNVLQIYNSRLEVCDTLLKVWFIVFVHHLTKLWCIEKQSRSLPYLHFLLELLF